jgi:hypothetical protein
MPARMLGETVNTMVYYNKEVWREYAVAQMRRFEFLARSLQLQDRLHLWPDQSMGSKEARQQFGPQSHNWNDTIPYDAWLEQQWNKISDWPGK